MARTPFAVAPTAIDDGLAQVHVFISYASEDVRLAQAIEAGLRKHLPHRHFQNVFGFRPEDWKPLANRT
jgi:hypothetical protein